MEYTGDLVAVGEVQNNGTTAFSSILVYGAAYNSSGYAVCTSDTEVIGLPELLPGQKAPFYMDFTPENSVTHTNYRVPTVTNVTLWVDSASSATKLRIPSDNPNRLRHGF